MTRITESEDWYTLENGLVERLGTTLVFREYTTDPVTGEQSASIIKDVWVFDGLLEAETALDRLQSDACARGETA